MSDNCSGKYFYHHPTRTNGTEIKLSCPDDLMWSKDVKTCVPCHLVRKADGHPCCTKQSGMDDEMDAKRRR